MYHEINQLHYGIAIERVETLFKDKSPYQEVEIFKKDSSFNAVRNNFNYIFKNIPYRLSKLQIPCKHIIKAALYLGYNY